MAEAHGCRSRVPSAGRVPCDQCAAGQGAIRAVADVDPHVGEGHGQRPPPPCTRSQWARSRVAHPGCVREARPHVTRQAWRDMWRCGTRVHAQLAPTSRGAGVRASEIRPRSCQPPNKKALFGSGVDTPVVSRLGSHASYPDLVFISSDMKQAPSGERFGGQMSQRAAPTTQPQPFPACHKCLLRPCSSTSASMHKHV